MFSLYYFVHLSGIIVWVGSMLSFGILLFQLKKKTEETGTQNIVSSISKLTNYMISPVAFLVLLSGLLMIMQMDRDTMPFYLSFMEQLGGLTVLGTIIVLTLQAKRLQKKLSGKTIKRERNLSDMVRVFSLMMFSFVLLAGLVLLVVSLRIA